jgi:hypothetical protein
LESCSGFIPFLDGSLNLDLSLSDIEEEGIGCLVRFLNSGSVDMSVSGYESVRRLLGSVGGHSLLRFVESRVVAAGGALGKVHFVESLSDPSSFSDDFFVGHIGDLCGSDLRGVAFENILKIVERISGRLSEAEALSIFVHLLDTYGYVAAYVVDVLGIWAGDIGIDALKSVVASLSAGGLRLLSFHSRLISLQSEEIGDLRSGLASAQSALSSVSESQKSSEASAAAQSASISRLERELAAKSSEVSDLRADLESKSAAIARLEGETKSKSAEILGLRAELQSKSKSENDRKEVFEDSVVGSGYGAFFDSWLGGRRRMGLLYRGTRDGFGASDFHRLCDNKGATVVLVRSSEGWVFGGYTPLPWNSSGSYQNDSSGTSFLFTLKNPHGTSPQKFALKLPQYAIECIPSYSPTFGRGWDLYISDRCNANTSSHTNFPSSYQDTGGRGKETFCGHHTFAVSEIEVFEVRA